MNTLYRIRNLHASDGRRERLGQFFCNRYLKGCEAVPGLFYEPDEEKAAAAISQWLRDHQYEDSLPPRIDLPRRIQLILLNRKELHIYSCVKMAIRDFAMGDSLSAVRRLHSECDKLRMHDMELVNLIYQSTGGKG